MRRSIHRVFALVFVLLVGVLSVSAQSAPEAIALDENKTGTISAATPSISYALLIEEPSVISARTFAITPGFAPRITIIDLSGNILADAPNASQATAAQTPSVSVGVGVYRVDVSSANGVFGDFLVNVEAAEVEPPLPLPGGTVVEGEVSAAAAREAYSFSGTSANELLLYVQNDLPTGGAIVTLKDEATDETLASVSTRLRGVRLLIPATDIDYLVEITYGGSANVEPYAICLASATAPQSCAIDSAVATQAPPVIVVTEVVVPTLAPTFLPPLPPSTVCIAASATGQIVNVRQGPSTTYPVVTQVNSTTIATVLGKLPDNTWYLVTVGGVTGWMSRSVIRFGGPCDTVPNVVPTATPTLAATATPTPTGTLFTSTPTSTPTATFTITPTPAGTLNYSLPPVFGSGALTAGFVPDPYSVGVTAGGPVGASYLGGACRGYMTSAPSFSVNYTSGGASLLRFYFVGSGDTTMVVNSPSASYFCADDSFGSLNPTIDFANPSSGRYDVWIGTFAQGGSIGGTLYVTELSGNHP